MYGAGPRSIRTRGIAEPLASVEAAKRIRNVALMLALVGLVFTAILINAGFWAAVLHEEAVAEGFSLPAIVSWAFTGTAFFVAILFHSMKVALRRR